MFGEAKRNVTLRKGVEMTNAQIFGRQWLQSSFVSPVPVPAYYPSDAPLVCVQFNADWLPLVIGALSQLTQPAAWQGDDGTQDAAVQCADDLIGIFSEAYGGAFCPMIQITDTCELQYSNDGGVTWNTATNWDTFAKMCFVGPAGVPGSVGPIGPSGPGVPVPLPGQSTTDLACSISGYLASQVIKEAVQYVVDGINGSQSTVEILAGFLAAVFLGPEGVVPVVGAINALYGLVEGGTIADYEAALTDTTLWSDVTCAIYEATSGTGYVNDDNFADVLANISAVIYTHTAVVTSIVSYLSAAGAIYLEAAQLPGALAVVDCSGCAETWCYEFDFTVSDQGWLAVSGQGTYVAATGWQSQIAGGESALYIYLPITAMPLTTIQVTYTVTDVSGGAVRHVVTYLSGTPNATVALGAGAQLTEFTESVTINLTTDEVDVTLDSSNPAAVATIIAVQLNGAGSNPFGSNNCTR